MIVARDGGCTLAVRVQPGARTARVVGVHGDALKIAVSAPPVEGRANEDVCSFVAQIAGVRPRQVSVVSGASNRSKVLLIEGVSAEELAARIATVR